MMNKENSLSLLFICILLLSACNQLKKPVFKTIKDVEVVSIDTKGLTIRAIAIHHNPNPVTGTLIDSDIQVFVNKIEIGRIQQDMEVSIPANADFEYNFEFNLDPGDIFNDQNLLEKISTVFLNKNVVIEFKWKYTL